MNTDVAFTQEYSRVSISMGNMKCTRESRPSKDKGKRRKIYIFLVGREKLSRVSKLNGRSRSDLLYFTYYGATVHF
jgi:hypothetical protein